MWKKSGCKKKKMSSRKVRVVLKEGLEMEMGITRIGKETWRKRKLREGEEGRGEERKGKKRRVEGEWSRIEERERREMRKLKK